MRTVYLNQAGTTWPKPLPVREAVRSVMESDPSEWSQIFAHARQAVLDFFHIPDPSQLLLTPGCTTALALAVTDHEWSAGDRVLTSGWEHHALYRPLVQLVERGVQLEILPHTPGEPIVLDELERALQQGGVRLVALSAASNVTGQLLPIREAIQLTHQYGALALIDGAQIAGWWDLDLSALGADLFAFAGHKGPHAPWGIGGLVFADHVTMNSPAATCELTDTPDRATCGTRPGFCDAGSVDVAALAGLGAAIGWLNEPVQADRLQQAQRRSNRLLEGLAELEQVTVRSPTDSQNRMPTIALTIHGQSPNEVARGLAELGVMGSAGLQCAPLAHQTLGTSPEGVIRLSIGPSNCDEEIELAIDAVTRVANRELA